MSRARVEGYINRARGALRNSISQESSPKEVAGSFSLGVFITMLPTLGIGLLVFVVLTYLFDRINRVALFASVVVINPPVKWGVYVGSLTLGVIILGPVDGVVLGEIQAQVGNVGQDVLVRLLVGNLILAVIATVVGYAVVHRLAVVYRNRELEIVEEVVDDVVEDVLVPEDSSD